MKVIYCSLVTILVIMVITPGGAQLTGEELDIVTNFGKINISEDIQNYLFSCNGLPKHDIGEFPGPGNPNSAEEHNFTFPIPKVPTVAEEEGCLPMGPIAVGINGVALFNPFNDKIENAVEGETAEIFDDCQGHPDVLSVYHYHQIPGCLYCETNNELVGVAFDGYPIYGPKDESGNTLTSADLDRCHGRMVDGVYRYHMTYDYPYILGCYHGETQPSPGPMGCYFTAGSSSIAPPPLFLAFLLTIIVHLG